MRRLLYWLGAATLAIIVIAGTGLGLFAYRGITLDASPAIRGRAARKQEKSRMPIPAFTAAGFA
jgi:hypothetical protein